MDSPSVKRANRPKSRYYYTIDGTLWKRIDSRSTTMSVPDQEHVSADGHLKTSTVRIRLIDLKQLTDFNKDNGQWR